MEPGDLFGSLWFGFPLLVKSSVRTARFLNLNFPCLSSFFPPLCAGAALVTVYPVLEHFLSSMSIIHGGLEALDYDFKGFS